MDIKQQLTTFYRLTECEKGQLVEQCRKEIEARKVREIEEVKKILEELLETEWKEKEKNAQVKMQVMLDDLQRQIVSGQEKLASSEKDVSDLRGQLTKSERLVSNLQGRLSASKKTVGELEEKLREKTFEMADLQSLQIELREKRENNKVVIGLVIVFCALMMVLSYLFCFFI